MGFYDERPCRCGGVRAIIYILGALFTLLLGGILGAVFAETVFANLALFIVAAAIVLLMLVITLIIRYCRQTTCEC